MPKIEDPDLARIKELWPGLPWWFKKKIVFKCLYYALLNRVNTALENVNFTWLKIVKGDGTMRESMYSNRMVRIVDRKVYNTETATLIADDEELDSGELNRFLYRIPKGDFFIVVTTQRQGEKDNLDPISREEAIDLFETLPEHHLSFSEAFPGVEVTEA